jgi:hypothetical protein
MLSKRAVNGVLSRFGLFSIISQVFRMTIPRLFFLQPA